MEDLIKDHVQDPLSKIYQQLSNFLAYEEKTQLTQKLSEVCLDLRNSKENLDKLAQEISSFQQNLQDLSLKQFEPKFLRFMCELFDHSSYSKVSNNKQLTESLPSVAQQAYEVEKEPAQSQVFEEKAPSKLELKKYACTYIPLSSMIPITGSLTITKILTNSEYGKMQVHATVAYINAKKVSREFGTWFLLDKNHAKKLDVILCDPRNHKFRCQFNI